VLLIIVQADKNWKLSLPEMVLS